MPTVEDLDLLDRQDEEEKISEPGKYAVLLVNDDFTPFDLVVYVVSTVFKLDVREAVGVMLKAHNDGEACCGIYTKDVAETKADEAMAIAKQYESALAFRVQKED